MDLVRLYTCETILLNVNDFYIIPGINGSLIIYSCLGEIRGTIVKIPLMCFFCVSSFCRDFRILFITVFFIHLIPLFLVP